MNSLRNVSISSLILFFVFYLISINLTAMADSVSAPQLATKSVDSSSAAAVHIVYTEQPQGDEPEAFHIQTLSSVLGSEEAAKESLIYVYKNAATGFSAKLTPEQVSELSKKPGVLQVVPSRTVQLHSGHGARLGLH